MESSDRLLYRKRYFTSIGSSCTMEQKILVLMAVVIANACIAGTIPATPENITVTFLTPTTVRVSWQTMIDLNAHPIEKYIVTYKPTDDSYRVVQDVAGNSEAIILDRLSPSTQYSIAVTAIWLGKKYRSRQIIFRTLDMPKTSSQQDYAPGHTTSALGSQNSVGNINAAVAGAGAPGAAGGSGVGVAGTGLIGGNLASAAAAANGNGTYGDDVTSTVTNTMAQRPRELPTIRGVEIGIVLIVLMVWAGAIALFFNRWGKIRMLLPYQPDYKHEQLKVPGTGVCTGAGCNGQHSHQHFHMLHEERSASISERCTRSRINSAIFVSSEGRGFDSIEFLRRHGSQSVLCRKARSAENITDNERKKSFSDNKGSWRNEGHIDSDPNASNRRQDDMDGSAIELRECRSNANNCSAGCCAESRTLSVLTTNTSCDHPSTSAAAAASMAATNVVVGSISIETPPSHIKDELHSSTASIAAATTAIVALQNGEKRQRPNNFAGMSTKISVSRDSSDTVEELVLVPTVAATAVPLPEIAITNRSRTLVRQRSSTVSISPHRSPKTIALKHAKPKIAALPMVSVSGPSPPHEKPPPQPQTEYL
uniref:Fibronectin type-III domain-containing protein n=2 Tax=Bactrocera latifrons TaxID=174628 RepID=A0A0K8V4U6_BACLA